MPYEEQLRLEVVFDDKATEQLVRLRGEMQKLTGPQMQGNIEKLQKQTEVLQRRMIPLYDSFSKTVESTQNFVRGLLPMGIAIGSIGAVATAAAYNVMRLVNKMQDLGRLALETMLPSATIKNIMDSLARAGVPSEVREQWIRSLSSGMADIQRESSDLTSTLRSLGRQGGAAGEENMEKHITLLRKLATEGKSAAFLKEVLRAIQYVHNVTDPNNPMAGPQRAAQLSKTLQSLWGLDASALRNIQGLTDATEEETKKTDEAIIQAMALEREINNVKVEITELFNEIAKLMGGVETATKIAKFIADVLEATVEFLKEFGKPMVPAEKRLTPEEFSGETFEGLPGLEGGTMVPQKQSFSGEGFGEGFGGMLIKARFDENTDRLEDDTRARHSLTEELRILNDFFRGRLGGGGGSGSSGSSTITTPDGARIVTHPNDVIRVADATITTPGGTKIVASSGETMHKTFYAPGASGASGMEGGFETSRAGQGGGAYPRTLDDYRIGRSSYVTGAVNQIHYGESFTVPQITYRSPETGEWHTLTDVPIYGHDTGGAFSGKSTSTYQGVQKGKKLDIAVGDFRGIDPQTGKQWSDLTAGRFTARNYAGQKDPAVVHGPPTTIEPQTKMAQAQRFSDNEWVSPSGRDTAETLVPSRSRLAREVGIENIGASVGGGNGEANFAIGGGEKVGIAHNLMLRRRANRGHDLSGLDRAMGNEMSHKVEGSGKINVEVGGAKNGSNGKSESLLKRTEMNRQTQMESAKEGPPRFI